MSAMTNKMSKASQTASTEETKTMPEKGDKFACPQCGMEIKVTKGCDCEDGSAVQFQCCGQEMQEA